MELKNRLRKRKEKNQIIIYAIRHRIYKEKNIGRKKYRKRKKMNIFTSK